MCLHHHRSGRGHREVITAVTDPLHDPGFRRAGADRWCRESDLQCVVAGKYCRVFGEGVDDHIIRPRLDIRRRMMVTAGQTVVGIEALQEMNINIDALLVGDGGR